MEALKWYGNSETEVLLSSSINVICAVICGVSGRNYALRRQVPLDAGYRVSSLAKFTYVQIFLYYVKFCTSERVQYLNIVSRLMCMARASRAFLYPRAHRELFGTDVFRNYLLTQVNDDVFHHLSRRYYLSKNL